MKPLFAGALAEQSLVLSIDNGLLANSANSASLCRAGASDGAENNETDCYNELPDVEETCALIDSVAENLKQRLREQPLDRQLLFGSQIFVQRYQAHKSNPLLASALHRVGWVFGGSITSKRFGNLQHGKRITVQATAEGRRRKGAKKGKGQIIPGRPAGNGTDKHSMSVRNEPKGKRIHSLAKSITKGTQNAGKWYLMFIIALVYQFLSQCYRAIP